MSAHMTPLGELLNFYNGKAPKRVEDGEFVLYGSNGQIGRSKSFNHANAIILGRVGAYCGSVEICHDKFWASDNTIVVKAKGDNDLRYIYYRLLSSPLRSYAGGAAQPLLTQTILRGVKLQVVKEASVQKQIASILTAYDDLIENNRRRIQLLEQAARLLYKEWFVHLRFSGHEHVKIKDGVPEGWKRKTLGDLCEEVRESVSPEALEPDTTYIGLEHMPRRSITLNEWGKAEQVTSSKHRFREGEILFGKIRPYFHKVGIALVDGIASSDAIVIRPMEDKLREFVLLTVSSDGFVALTSQTMKEGSKMQRADWKQMQQHIVPLPPDGLLSTFNSVIEFIVKQLKSLSFANQNLIAARDLLLPRLMNGEVAV